MSYRRKGEPPRVTRPRPEDDTYLFGQFLPMLLALLLKIGAGDTGQVADNAWWTVLALYAAAKGIEMADQSVLQTMHFTSGHTLKHLLAAAAAWWMLRAASGTGAVNSGSRR